MTILNLRRVTGVALAIAAATALVGCSTDSGTEENASATTITVASKDGDVEVPVNPDRVVALDSTSLETLKDWGITPVAVPKSLIANIPELADWYNDENILDVGSHKEPDLEAVSEAEPDLVIGGYRFESYTEELKEAAGGAPVIDIAPDEESEGGWVGSLETQTTILGQIFEKEDEAAELVSELESAKSALKEVAEPAGVTALDLIVSGGEVQVSGGRLHIFEDTGLTQVSVEEVSDEESETAHGQQVALERIAQANPDWVVVIDRDAGTGEDGASPAEEVISGNEAFAETTFVTEGQIYVLPSTFYVTESIQAYTDAFTTLAEKIAAA